MLRYYITDRRAGGRRGRRCSVSVERAIRDGVERIQVREKDLCCARIVPSGTPHRGSRAGHATEVLVNSRVDVALAAGADGVHLPASSVARQNSTQQFCRRHS